MWKWFRKRKKHQEIDRCKEIVDQASRETLTFCRETGATDGLLVKRHRQEEWPITVVIGFGQHYTAELEQLVKTIQENDPFRQSTPLDDVPPGERPS